MERLIPLLLMCCSLVCVVTGCNNLSEPEYVKTEFKLNENALIDNYELQLIHQEKTSEYQNKYSKNGQYIILTFKMKNNAKTDQVINESNFDLKLDDQIYEIIDAPNIYINAHETKEYTIIYDVPIADDYALLFYSGVVTNNIKFVIEF